MHLLLPLLLSLVSPPTSQPTYKIEAGQIDGAHYKIATPEAWNGRLLIHAHGGRPKDAPLSADFDVEGTHNAALLEAGWMIAGTSYRRNGIIIEDAMADIEALRRLIEARSPKPERIYLMGVSMGGKIAARLLEERPGAYAGAVLLCAALLCEDGDIDSCDQAGNLDELSFKPHAPALLYSNINEVERPRAYAERARKSGAKAALWTSKRRGHCNINRLERAEALRALVGWAERGEAIKDGAFDRPIRRGGSSAAWVEGRLTGLVTGVHPVYGTLSVDLRREDLDKAGVQQDQRFRLTCEGRHVEPLLGYTYSDVPQGEWIAFVTAEDRLRVARNWANAQEALACGEGARVTLAPQSSDKGTRQKTSKPPMPASP